MILLDSDIFTLLTYGHEHVCRRNEAVRDEEQIGVTSITRMEFLRRRTDSLIKAANEQELMAATTRLQATEAALADFLLVHLDEGAANHFKTLRGQKNLNRIGRNDMLIACVALAHDALLVTRNTKDFNKVAGLRLANWADD